MASNLVLRGMMRLASHAIQDIVDQSQVGDYMGNIASMCFTQGTSYALLVNELIISGYISKNSPFPPIPHEAREG